MPFTDGKRVFIFNGELRGVRIADDVGAEKIFNFIRRFDKGTRAVAQRGVDVINKRTRYVRAMNFVIASPDEVHVSSTFGEDPDYFQQHSRSESLNIVCPNATATTIGKRSTTTPTITQPKLNIQRHENYQSQGGASINQKGG